jgi:hypothetical protein
MKKFLMLPSMAFVRPFHPTVSAVVTALGLLSTGMMANTASAAPVSAPRAFYLNATVDTKFHNAYSLSDGTLLIAGEAGNLNWVPTGVPRIALGLDQITSVAAGKVGFIVQVSGDLSTVIRVVHFPAGSVRSVYKIRGTEIPGQPTGALVISGHRDGVANSGYYLARLNGNFVDSVPTALTWGRDVNNRGEADGGNSHKSIQPWDVGSDGKVSFVEGKAFDANWVAIYRLNANGEREVVPNWRNHWTAAGPEWRGTPASASPTPLSYSGIVMKSRRVGQLRSADASDFAYQTTDENNNPGRRGRYPDDYYFQQHCAFTACSTAQPGYTGYRIGASDTQRVGGVVIDRRTNDLYLGYSTQSRLPGGSPDFEPAVVSMNASGSMRWWARLYRETTDNSSPDQFVDGLELDYTNNRLVVLARAHGNNVVNFWSGNQLQRSPGANGYQNQFTGTNGNIHISWLAKYALSDGHIHNATWIAELNEGQTGGAASTDPIMGGWPNPNSGWPNLNTTRCRNGMSVYADGSVLVSCVGRRTATTVNAYQKMPLPTQQVGTWNEFVRVYKPDLSGLRYSSLLTGNWDKTTGAGGGNVALSGAIAVSGGLLTVGYHQKDSKTGLSQGVPIPATNIPSWGKSTPVANENAVLGLLPF